MTKDNIKHFIANDKENLLRTDEGVIAYWFKRMIYKLELLIEYKRKERKMIDKKEMIKGLANIYTDTQKEKERVLKQYIELDLKEKALKFDIERLSKEIYNESEV